MADLDMMQLLKVVIVMQLFFSFGITALAYAIPGDAKNYVQIFTSAGNSSNLQDTATKVQDSLQSQTNIPVIELGALVFYSGNILIDFLLNFAFAIPEMIGLLINGFMLLFGIDSYLFALIQLFSSVVIIVMYFVGLIQLLTGIRSGRVI